MAKFGSKLKKAINDLAKVAKVIPGPIGKIGNAVDNMVNTDDEKATKIMQQAEQGGGTTNESETVGSTKGASDDGTGSGGGDSSESPKGFKAWWGSLHVGVKIAMVVGAPIFIGAIIWMASKNKKGAKKRW